MVHDEVRVLRKGIGLYAPVNDVDRLGRPGEWSEHGICPA